MTHDHDPDFTNPKLNGAQPMSSADKIAEVLAAHQWYDASSSEADEPAIGCTGCDDWFSDENALDNGAFAAHQAAMLEPVIRERDAAHDAEVAAKALEDAADHVSGIDGRRDDAARDWLRARAAGIRVGE